MSEHTPGPWEVIDKTDVYPVDDEQGNFYVADCWPAAEHEACGTDLTLEAAHANARLIAAAPDLLEAAQVAFDYLYRLHDASTDHEIVQVLAALAKAISKALDGDVR